MVGADAELVDGADHAVGDVSVRLPRGQQEPTRERRARERHDDEVADDEVVGAADDAAGAAVLGRLAGAGVVNAHVDAAPADDLAVLLRLVDDAQHAADRERTGDLGRRLDAFDLEARADQRVADVTTGDVGRQGYELPYPGNRCPHRAPPTSDRLNRTSPSTMSRMSAALLRNIRLRSTPMPNAKPLYSDASMPHAVSTRGFTTPQPPHSIQPSLEHVRHGFAGSLTLAPWQTKHSRSSSALGLGEREVVGPDPDLDVAEHDPREVLQRADQVGHRDALVDDEALDLVEDRYVRGVELVGAVDLARAHHVDRQRPVEHGARLDRRRVRTEHDVVLDAADEQRVGRAARRVVGADVEGVEVEPGRLGLGAFGDLPSHRDEDVAEDVHEGGDGMYGADRYEVDRDGDVDALVGEDPAELRGADLGLASNEGPLDLATCGTDAGAGVLAGGGGQRADLTVGEGQRRLVAGVGDPGGLELGERGRGGNSCNRLVDHGLYGLGAQGVTCTGS